MSKEISLESLLLQWHNYKLDEGKRHAKNADEGWVVLGSYSRESSAIQAYVKARNRDGVWQRGCGCATGNLE